MGGGGLFIPTVDVESLDELGIVLYLALLFLPKISSSFTTDYKRVYKVPSSLLLLFAYD